MLSESIAWSSSAWVSDNLSLITTKIIKFPFLGIDDDDEIAQPEASTSAAADMPPLEGAEDDATRMEEVD